MQPWRCMMPTHANSSYLRPRAALRPHRALHTGARKATPQPIERAATQHAHTALALYDADRLDVVLMHASGSSVQHTPARLQSCAVRYCCITAARAARTIRRIRIHLQKWRCMVYTCRQERRMEQHTLPSPTRQGSLPAHRAASGVAPSSSPAHWRKKGYSPTH